MNPSQGATIPFDSVIDVPVDVIDPKTKAVSARKSINPGKRFSAINPNGQSPFIDGVDINNVTPKQSGIRNGCDAPKMNIGLNWYNLGKKVVMVGMEPPDIINFGKTVTFELQPTLYFMAADSTTHGPNYVLQEYSETTPYNLSVDSDVVHVRWYRDSISGQDKFEFAPSSRSVIEEFLVEEGMAV